MMNFKKFLSLFLAALMLCSVLATFSVVSVSADEAVTEPSTGTEAEEKIEYQTQLFASPEEKLATMKLMITKGNYAIYADAVSGEVAVKDLSSGQILFTNPYDVGASTAAEDTKNEILSQIVVKFSENGREREFTSYEHAAMKDQIKVKNIKNGIRVEYTIGREEARRLVPRRIKEERFLEQIQAPMEEYYGVTYADAQNFKDISGHPLQSPSFYLCKQMSYFQFQSLDNCASDRLKEDMLATFPIVSKFNIYVWDPSATITEMEKVEEIIKTACPNYSYEEMDYDHQLTEYTSEDENPPVFKMALEYKIEDDGFTVRLPANGIRFNETKFQLLNVSVLPYMGAGNGNYEGYTFYPDGSGALFAFEDLVDTGTASVSSKIYGVDYAYHKITGTYQQTVRYPVFGVMENTRYYDCVTNDEATGEDRTTTICGTIYDLVDKAIQDGLTGTPAYKQYGGLVSSADVEEYNVKRGYVAIIEEGDALTELVNYHAGVLSEYNTVKMNFSPRPQDSYNIADAISVGSNSVWTVVSDRKYVGSYKIHYVMLADENIAKEEELPAGSWYDASWMGMATAYRDYLVGNGTLTPLAADRTSNNIPLYIESFGAMETVEKILSIPVEVTNPLTSAQNVMDMYKDLAEQGVDHINFKLTGFANGGMYATMPYGLKWEKAIEEGDYTMQDLFTDAAAITDGNLGLFPDFDFSYVMMIDMFDGFSMRKHAVRTIDDRYSYKREWIPTQQKYAGYYQMAISPAYFSHFYEKLMTNYLKYDDLSGISVGSLGNALNSDFDEDEPYNREDSKGFVTKALEYISGVQNGALDVMVDGGNAYTWQYVDHILGVPLDSSRYISASYSVPFIGVVLHGHMNFAGSPLNMEGDVNYAKLKAIENGASIYFTLSYQNTQNLKEDFYLNRYYSVRYDIWEDDVVEIYNELNKELKDVQDKLIIDHQFLSGSRVPDTNELDRDIANEFKDVLDRQNRLEEILEEQKTQAVADARDKIASVEVQAERFVKDFVAYYSSLNSAAFYYANGKDNFERRFATYYEAKAAYDMLQAEYEAADEAGKATLATKRENALNAKKQAYNRMKNYIRYVCRSIATIEAEYNALTQLLEDAQSGALLINNTEGCPPSIINEIAEQLANTEKFLAQKMGVTFNFTVDKAEVDTFVYTHIATLMLSSYGTNAADSNIGKAETLYNMLASGDYGLLYTEIDLLRYLPENADKTDEQLIKEYGLSENKSSVDGLVKYMSQLLGDGFEFDPVIAGTEGGKEKNIREYFASILFEMTMGLGDSSILPALNFVPTRLTESGRPTSNSSNIRTVTNEIIKLIDTQLTGKNGALGKVTDGNYDLDTVFASDKMDALIKQLVEIINKHTPSQSNPTPTAPIEYATPDTLEADLRNYVESVYYRAVISKIAPEDAGKVTLKVLTVSYKTDSSMELLADFRMDAYEYGTYKYADLIKAMRNDAELSATLDRLSEQLKATYGEGTRENLENAFLRAFATLALGKDKTPTLPNKQVKVDNETFSLRGEANTLLEEKQGTLTLETMDAVVAELVKIHEKYTMDEDYDVQASSENYIAFFLLQNLTTLESYSYYYDDQMAAMDATVLAKVEEVKGEIMDQLPEGFTVYDLYDLMTASLAKKDSDANDEIDDSLQGFINAVAAEITHTADGKGSIKDDVLAYYSYLLFNSFTGYELGEEAPEVKLPGSSINQKNGMKIVDGDLEKRIPLLMAEAKTHAERGDIVNYSLSSFKSAADIDGIANEIFDALVASLFVTEKDREALVPQLKDYFLYNYYYEVADKLGADKMPEFHVSEIYGDTLSEAASNLKDLLTYYVLTFTEYTQSELDRLFESTDDDDVVTEEEEASRYLSDDGRIVSVTYGNKNENGSYTAYKTFILNYNSFSVNVVYDDVTYTIPAYGYVVVMADAGTNQ